MRLPIRTVGMMAAALLIGSSLAPAEAQQQRSGLDGQVALRASDGALYIISNGQRRWVATVVASDEEINALPEGEPIFVGLAPAGTSTGTVAATKPSTTTRSGSRSQQSNENNENASSDDDANTELSEDIPIELSLEGETRIERGESRKVEIKTRRNASCGLKLVLPDGDEEDEDDKDADSQGRCRYTIEIPSNAQTGEGRLIGTVREGGKINRQEIGIEIRRKR